MTVNLETGIILAVIGMIGGAITSLLYYAIIVSGRFSRLEAKSESHDKFIEMLMQKMVSILISPHHPEVDRILLAMRRGEALTDDDLRLLDDELEREYEEILKSPDQYESRNIERKIALSFFIAYIAERRHRRKCLPKP